MRPPTSAGAQLFARGGEAAAQRVAGKRSEPATEPAQHPTAKPARPEAAARIRSSFEGPMPIADNELLRLVARAYDELNTTRFRRALVPPVFAWLTGHSRWGSWQRATRTLRMSREGVQTQPWGFVVEVLLHEMAHQYVDEVLRVTDETAHGPAFQGVCARLGIDAAAAGAAPGAPSPTASPALDKLRKLLALAQSDNVHEAERAMAAAQRWMLRHNLDATATQRSYGVRWLGAVKGRFSPHEKLLAGILSQHFFVTAIWIQAVNAETGVEGRQLEVSGTPENLDMAEHVFAFLTETGERLWRDHRRAHGLRADTHRRTFLSGVMNGFRDKLHTSRREAAAEGLVWVGDGDLDAFYHARHPRVRTTHFAVRGGDAYHAGRVQGQQVVLHRPVSADVGNKGRQLEDRKPHR